MRAAVLIPAYQAERSVGPIVAELGRVWPDPAARFVVDDGSTDETSRVARAAGASVLRHEHNRGKGAALRTGFRALAERGFDVAVTLDADGQHPPTEALRLLEGSGDAGALVLGVRDLAAARAPRPNQLSNALSNLAVSGLAWHRFHDTQCGLRRYPLAAVLGLGARDDGFGFESELLVLAAAAGLPIVELPVRVIYPPGDERVTHFDTVRDPARIVWRLLGTAAAVHWQVLRRRCGRAA